MCEWPCDEAIAPLSDEAFFRRPAEQSNRIASIFAAGTGILTRAECGFGFAFKHLLGVLAGALAFWAVGGLAAMGLATLSPEFYRAAFIGVPEEFGPMLAYAWVGGSIRGVQFGGLVSVILVLVLMRAHWHKRTMPDRTRLAPPEGAIKGEGPR